MRHRHLTPQGEVVHKHPLAEHDIEEWATAYPVRTRVGKRRFKRVWEIITKGSHARYLLGKPDRLEKP